MVKSLMDETKKGFMQNIGNLSFKKIDEKNFEFSIKILENFFKYRWNSAWWIYCYNKKILVWVTQAHVAAGNKRCVTINLDIKFISAGQLNEKLIGNVKVLKKTKSLVFISCEIMGSSNIVAVASGTWKIL